MFKHSLDISQYFMVPESYDFITQRLKKGASLQVSLHLFKMLSAISLHDESRLKTYEIHNVGFNYNLTPEFITRHSMGT